MSYVIQRNSDRAFVARRPNPSSYTRSLQAASNWPTREAAEREACGNETVLSVEEAMIQ